MKKVKGMPITGAKPRMNSTPPVKTTSNTSADAEKLVRQPPAPFHNPNSAAKAPAGVGTKNAGFSPMGGLSGSAAPKFPAGGATGYRKLPDQSKQIGKRTGVESMKSVIGYKDNPHAGSMGRQPIRGANSQGHMSGLGLAKVAGVPSGPSVALANAGLAGSPAKTSPNGSMLSGGRNPNVGRHASSQSLARKTNKKGQAAFYGE